MEKNLDRRLLLRVVGCLPQRDDVGKTIKVGVGVTQAPREETAEIW
jgi:hypothetical protein